MKEKLIRVLAEIAGFDIELNLYRSAGSFEDALPLFFDRLLGKLKAVNNIYSELKTTAEVVSLRSKHKIKVEIDEYLKKVYDDVLVTSIQQYIEIVKMYQKPKTEEKNRILVETMKTYLGNLDTEFLDINKTSRNLISIANKSGMDKQVSFRKSYEKLNFLTKLTTSEFTDILKKGNIDSLL